MEAEEQQFENEEEGFLLAAILLVYVSRVRPRLHWYIEWVSYLYH